MVLKGLRSLENGCPTNVFEGPSLPSRSLQDSPAIPPLPPSPPTTPPPPARRRSFDEVKAGTQTAGYSLQDSPAIPPLPPSPPTTPPPTTPPPTTPPPPARRRSFDEVKAGTQTAGHRSSVSGSRAYSSVEDHEIVAWVSTGPRCQLVNGNRLWKELQQDYQKLTGRSRSWHSLRNRYLRHILPSLGSYALPDAQVARLRAGAANGVIKTKRKSNTSRAARDPAMPPRDAATHHNDQNSGIELSPNRRLRSRSPPRPPPAAFTSYAEKVRAFAARRRARE